MSRWATETNVTLSPESGAPGVETPSRRPGAGLSFPWWLRALPFGMSGVLFLSAFFSIFSPLPLLFLSFRPARHGRALALAAAITNSALVYFAAGAESLALYLIFVVGLALPMAEALRRRKSIEIAGTAALVSMVIVTGALSLNFSRVHHASPWAAITRDVSNGLDQLVQSVQERGSPSAPVEPAEIQEWKKNILTELPSAIGVIALIMVWANLLLLLRLNPGGVRESLGLDALFFQRWKAPELLVWPTIACGVFLLVEVPTVSVVALNLFKFLMAIYALQGLSILSFLFSAWNVRGLMRSLGFLISIFLMMPLLLSLGFFDLWFDFRGKIRQS